MQPRFGDPRRWVRLCGYATLAGCLVLAGCVLPNFGSIPSESTLPPAVITPEATITQTQTFMPVETPAPESTPSGGPQKPEEPEVKITQTPDLPPTATPAPFFDYTYQLQGGSPSYLPNIFHPESACQWFGVAGQIFDEDGLPVMGLIVEVEGELDGQPILHLGISGSAPQYGNGGYELVLGDQPKTSQNTLTIVVFDTGGKQLTERLPFITSDSCTQNLIIMNFLATSFFESEFYLPMLQKTD